MPPKVLNHFKKVDPILYRVIKEIGNFEVFPKRQTPDMFVDLVESIISQQLSGKASDTIFTRFSNLFPKRKIEADKILKLNNEKIRGVGVSYSKVTYIKDLASKVENGQLDLKKLTLLEDEAVILELVKVKGIGRWTGEMFLISSLRREDVFSHGDLGLNNAIKKIYKRKDYSKAEVEKIVSKWSPYKSYASRILWKSLDNR